MTSPGGAGVLNLGGNWVMVNLLHFLCFSMFYYLVTLNPFLLALTSNSYDIPLI
jgi:hypothetical protein